MSASQMMRAHFLASDEHLRVVGIRDLRKPRLLARHHVGARVLMDQNLSRRVHQHERISARVIAVLVGIQDVFDRLVADGLHLRQDLRAVLVELVIHQQHALAGGHHRDVAATACHQHPQVVGHLLDVERLLWRLLRLKPNQQ